MVPGPCADTGPMASIDDAATGAHMTTAAQPAGGSVAPPGLSAAAPAPMAVLQPRATRRAIWTLGSVVMAAAAAVALLLLALGGRGSSAERAIAQAINLHASDLPGFTVAPPDHSGTGQQLDSRMKACVGSGWIAQHSGGHLVDVSSPQFTSGSGLQTEQVGSDVAITRSTRSVSSDLAAISSGRIQGCLAPTLDGLAIPTQSGAVVTIDNVQVIPLAAPAGGSDGSFGIRTTMTMNALGINVPVILDILGYAVGKDELSLDAFTIGHPLAVQTEQQLSSLLISRALSRPH